MDNQTNNKFNKKKITGIIGAATGFLIVYFAIQQVFFKPPTIDKQIMQIASELNKSCPIMVDSETQLDNAVGLPGKTIQYNYTFLNMEKATVDTSELENYLQPKILNNIKTNPDLKNFRENDVIMVYNYKDKKGEHLFKLTFKPEKYK